MTTAVIPAYHMADTALGGAVRAALHIHGVPTSLDAADRLAGAVLPSVLDSRRMLAAREAEALRSQFRGLTIPTTAPWYPETALQKLTRRAAGLTPNSDDTLVELYSAEAQKMAKVRAAPWVYPGEEQMIKVMADRLIAGAGRHARSASRDLVLKTARLNGVPWGRQLNGESCTFCAMLASRGGVYSEESVRFLAHDHCDCTATLAVGDNWDGLDQAAQLREAWMTSKGMAAFGEKVKEIAL